MNARKSTPAHDSDFLFGSGAGHMTIAEGAFSVRFFGGRLNALQTGESPTLRRQRVQGYVQTPDRNWFLETQWSTWFERDGDRGIQEESKLESPDGPIVVQTESVVLDGIPALIIRLKSELPTGGASPLERATPWRLLLHRDKGEPPPREEPQNRPHLVRHLEGNHAEAVLHVLEDEQQHPSAGLVTDMDPAGFSTVSYHPLWYLNRAPLSQLGAAAISTALILHAPEAAPTPAGWKRIRRWIREARNRDGFFYNDSTSPE